MFGFDQIKSMGGSEDQNTSDRGDKFYCIRLYSMWAREKMNSFCFNRVNKV